MECESDKDQASCLLLDGPQCLGIITYRHTAHPRISDNELMACKSLKSGDTAFFVVSSVPEVHFWRTVAAIPAIDLTSLYVHEITFPKRDQFSVQRDIHHLGSGVQIFVSQQ